MSAEARKALNDQTTAFSIKTWKPAPDPGFERARLRRRAQRYDRYQQVVALHPHGFEQAEIAHRVGLSTRTMQKWLKAGAFPEARPRRKRRSLFDPYAPYVLMRWKQGCKNGLQLYREIKEKGYTGTERQVYRFLTPLRKQLPLVQSVEAPQTPVQDFSAHEAVWLFVRHPDDLDETEQVALATILSACETARTMYQLVQEFRQILHRREGEKLDSWLEAVRASHIRELQSFVGGIERDKAAVPASVNIRLFYWAGRRPDYETQIDQEDYVRASRRPLARPSGAPCLVTALPRGSSSLPGSSREAQKDLDQFLGHGDHDHMPCWQFIVLPPFCPHTCGYSGDTVQLRFCTVKKGARDPGGCWILHGKWLFEWLERMRSELGRCSWSGRQTPAVTVRGSPRFKLGCELLTKHIQVRLPISGNNAIQIDQVRDLLMSGLTCTETREGRRVEACACMHLHGST